MSLTLASEVKHALASAMRKAFPTLPAEIEPIITISNPKFGDYQCNSAMALFKENKQYLEGATSPKAVADKIEEHLPENLFSKVTVAKQGFITVQISPKKLQSLLVSEVEGLLGKPNGKQLRCLVDYSSPNIAKEMHVGHLRSTILGESICRVLEALGHEVLRVNHLGDWGTQFGMLIEYMREKHPNFQENPPNVTDLTTFYREAKIRFDNDEQFKRRAQLAVPQLQRGDPSARAAWKLFCDVSRADFQKIYDRFGISLIERGESFYNDMLPGVIEEIEAKGFITESDGAKCFFVKDDPVPLMVVKSDGGFGYDSTDLAAAKHRLQIEKHDWVIAVTDVGQESHFSKIFKAAEAMGWHRPPTTRMVHVGFGLVQGEDGKKFKTRSGDLVKLTDLLDEAVERCLKEVEARRQQEDLESHQVNDKPANASSSVPNCNKLTDQSNNDANQKTQKLSSLPGNTNCEASELSTHQVAEAIGYSAIRYFDLKQNRISNYRFSYDRMLDPKGNTAVYLLYAYARICALFRRAGVDPKSLHPSSLHLSEPQERELALQMLKFYDIVNSVAEDFYVHRIAEYMYDLSGSFTNFYQNCKVVRDANQESRLMLCELTRRFLQVGTPPNTDFANLWDLLVCCYITTAVFCYAHFLLQKSFYLLGIVPLERL